MNIYTMSQDKQDKSKDMKEDVQPEAVPAKKVKLGDELKQMMAMRQIDDAKKLYDTKFVPWVTDQASKRNLGEGFPHLLRSVFGSYPPDDHIWVRIQAYALEDGLKVSDFKWISDGDGGGAYSAYVTFA
jgi:hypothetical protein